MQRIMIATLTAFTGSGLLLAQSSSNSSVSSQDHTFIQDVAKDNQSEIDMGKLGAQKASNSMVKSYAQTLVTDHSKSKQDLDSLASKKGVSITSGSPSSDADHQRLSNLSGAEFDRAFVTQMVMDHEKAISKFEQQQKNTTDPDVRSFISNTLPTLRSHLDQAKMLERSTKGG